MVENSEASARRSHDRRENTVICGRYRVGALLGSGAMANVYRARNIANDEVVAVKILHRSMTFLPDAVVRFEREAVAASSIEHENVARAFDYGKLEDGSFFIVLEYVAGERLDCVIEEQGRLTEWRSLAIARQIGRALMASHELGIIHRDLKPENVIIARGRRGQDLVKVLDFGIAKMSCFASAQPITAVGAVFGTPEYMSPEQARGRPVDARCDLYSFGIILYEMLAGESPFAGGDPVVVLRKVLSEKAPRLANHVSAPLRELVERLIDKDPERRPQSAADVVRQIEDLMRRSSASSGRIALDAAADGVSSDDAGPIDSAPPAAISVRPAAGVQRSIGSVRWLAACAAGLLLTGFGYRLVQHSAPREWSGRTYASVSVGLLAPASPLVRSLATEVADARQRERDQVEARARAAREADQRAERERMARAAVQRISAVPAYRRTANDWRVLGENHTALGEHREAVSAYSGLLSLDQDSRHDPKLSNGLRAALLDPKGSSAALNLCASPLMGGRGLDILFDTWREIRREPAQLELAARVWQQLLTSEDRATKALRTAIALERSTRCEELASMLPSVARHADARAADRLNEIATRTNCVADDCYLCLAGNPLLAKTIEKLR